jgi:hypothetical protein
MQRLRLACPMSPSPIRGYSNKSLNGAEEIMIVKRIVAFF